MSTPRQGDLASAIVVSAFFGLALCFAGELAARPRAVLHHVSEPEVEVDVVGDVDGSSPAPRKVLSDTFWIADWTFETGSRCNDTGWQRVDNRIMSDGRIHWTVTGELAGVGGITGQAATLGYDDSTCCAVLDGYANDWYQAIRIPYTGAATLAFRYLLDSEENFDFLRVESDSLCSSFERYDLGWPYSSRPLRRIEYQESGHETNGAIPNTGAENPWDGTLRNYGEGTHCVYIAFLSDSHSSPCDGLVPTTLGEALVLDDIVIADGSGVRREEFEDGSLDLGTFVNMQDSKPFGEWARLYFHVTDNDVCTENVTCAWLWTDYTTPSLATYPSEAYGPGGYVIKNFLDDVIISPWVSLATSPAGGATVLQFRRFPGNSFGHSKVVQSWSVRGKEASANAACVSDWGPTDSWNSLSSFRWRTVTFDMTRHFDPAADEIQVRFRTSDWIYIAGASCCHLIFPGPGPYIDRVRIGRRILAGPVITEGTDSRSQAQDCFATEIHPGVTPAGEHHRPTMDRFGTCAFSEGTELGINKTSPNIITGDSIWVEVRDLSGASDVAGVEWFGALVAGPHRGKAPPPWTVAANGFFTVPAEDARDAETGAVLPNRYFVDLDDTYFRGGDVLHYLWLATDIQGAATSDPEGLTAAPMSIAEAQQETQGLLEVSFLPTIHWSQNFLDRIAADPNGDLEPTAGELAASQQANCILYVNNVNSRRRSGDVNRTSFMYALDRLGYRDRYDTYDHQGMGNTNNQLGGRATVAQAQGYSLIVYDNGNGAVGRPLLPSGVYIDSEKVDQAGWLRDWLAQAATSEAGFATLWIIGSNTVTERGSHGLILTDMGVILTAYDQGLDVNPNVDGVASMSFEQGAGVATVDFSSDFYSLSGGCPEPRDYDGLNAVGSATITHCYRHPSGGSLGPAAIVMNTNPAGNWNTILQSHPWFDIRDPAGAPAATPPELPLLNSILRAVLPASCTVDSLPTTDVPEPSPIAAPMTFLHPSTPNPCNPATTLRFDLARAGHVLLRIHDVAGRLVRTLVDAEMAAGQRHAVLWDGRDDAGRQVPSGVYVYGLEANGARNVRKLVVLR